MVEMLRDFEGSPALPPKPWGIHLADWTATGLAAVIAWDVLTDGARAGLFGFLSGASWSLLLYIFAAVVVVRHTVHPWPTLFFWWRHRWNCIVDDREWGTVVRAFTSTRLVVFVIGFVAVVVYGRIPNVPTISDHPLYNMVMRFDAGYYGSIAVDGYDRDQVLDRQRNIAFFPGMPLLMRAFGPFVGANAPGLARQHRMGRFLWAGVLISLASFLIGLFYVGRLAALTLDDSRARSSILFLATYPAAMFFSAPYTEGLMLLGTAAAAFYFLQRQFGLAAVLGFVVGLTRPNGFLLAVPFGVLAMTRFRGRPSHESDSRHSIPLMVLAVVMPVVGMLAFTIYLEAITGVWFAWQKNHNAWGRSFTGITPVISGLQTLESQGLIMTVASHPFDAINIAAAMFGLIMLWPVIRHVGVAWALYVFVNLIPPILFGGALSLARITCTLFPIFIALAAVVPARSVPYWAICFAALQGLCAALFFTWRGLF